MSVSVFSANQKPFEICTRVTNLHLCYRRTSPLFQLIRIDYFFCVYYQTGYPSDNSQPYLKEGPTKDSYFFFKSSQVKRTPPPPQDSIYEFIIPKLNPFVSLQIVDLNLILVGWLLGKLEERRRTSQSNGKDLQQTQPSTFDVTLGFE